MKRYLTTYIPVVLLVSIVVLLDQWSKAIVQQRLAFGEMWSPWEWLAPYARIVHISNSGVAFGLFQGNNEILKYLAILVSAAIIFFYPRIPAKDWLLRLALGLQLSGAMGNLVDRFRVGYVIDFISLGNFAVFNVADSCITVGVGIMLLGLWLDDRRKKLQPSATQEAVSQDLEQAKNNSEGESSS